MPAVDRRTFLKRTAALTAATTILPHARVLGANDDIRMAVVGFRQKGMQHIGHFKGLSGVRVVAICDVDADVVKLALQKHFSDGTPEPRVFTDVRKLLQDKEIDAICIAAPNHWHAPMTVWACQAGKDVYVEKPCSHDLWEGQQMIAAAEKYRRIVQIGMQSRSDTGLQEAFKHIKEGNLGQIQRVRGFYYNLRQPIGKVSGPQPVPPNIDYDLWLGPAPEAPLMRQQLHYDWHWQWAYGNGELGNNGVHQLDLALWVLGITDFPTRVVSIGGRFNFNDDGETPNTHITFYDYKPCPVYYELRNLPRAKGEEVPNDINGHRLGIEVKCEGGTYLGYATGGWVYDNDGKRAKQFPGDGGGAHQQNFIDAVRSRKPESLNTDLAKGHLAAGLAHIGNVSHRLGTQASGDQFEAAIEGVPLLEDGFERFQEHLLLNTADVKQNPRILGPWLSFDPQAQQFTGERAEEANALLKRPSYRKGFEIPEQV